ncbi:alkaline phosphatase family protein [Crenalkalicoccus roseus]|uniref:alkaline phosphatase family protein n=1 Tax=Crenalkalicoccus roseus TaxID=1485588 RepID=UPI001305364D|nr:alkaline phosphatase family protein [Crenalkalicoccus roseus]
MRCVLVVLDGLRPDLVTPRLMPHLARLAGRGTRFAAARSVFPSETRVATASLVTGCRPDGHGLVANTLFDAALTPERLLRTDRPADLRLLAGGAPSPLRRPGLGEVLAAAGRSLAVVSTGTPGQTLLAHPQAEALGAFRWNAEDTETEAARLIAARLGPTPPAAVPNLARIAHAARALTEVVLPGLAPDITLLWCSEPDLSFHYRGLLAPEARAALAAADAALGRVLAWREAQPDAAEIVVMALSDHGHVTGHRRLDVAAELRRGGFAAGQGMAGEVEVVVAPAAAPGLWLRDAALAPRLAAFLAAQPWAGPLLARDAALLPEALPLALLEAAHPRSPDLVLLLAGEEGPDAWGLPGRAPFDAPSVPEGGGMHGGLHRRELATVLVAEGGPFRPAATVRAACDLADIAPTLLHLLGLAAGEMRGRVLREGWEAAADAPPEAERIVLPRGFVLEAARQAGRLYPTGLRRG